MNRIQLLGFDRLGENGHDGIRYAWKCDGYTYLLESAAFKNKTKGLQGKVSGYTTSVSLGCILKYMGVACQFCRTGKMMPFSTFLSSKEIAKQNILMVLLDMENKDKEYCQKAREFAYMGQGEPGYSYIQLRQAIKITDRVLQKLGQITYRHIISTSGMDDMLLALAHDLKTNYFETRVTVHYSLHGTQWRSKVMPINTMYPYEGSMELLKKISEIIGEKVCLGVLLLNDFHTDLTNESYKTRKEDFDILLNLLDNQHFRFSLCEYNSIDDEGEVSDVYPEKQAQELLDYIRKRGFEGKMFSSFGKKEKTACGMLGGQQPEFTVDASWKKLEIYAQSLIDEAADEILLDLYTE